ncbi:hypothetical protein TNCV_827041 [Trichonephila clavipes]|nr:hypothetical protein TNCV_827041 [Trichonephila clavipes]
MSTTEDNMKVVEGLVIEGMASIQVRYHIIRKQKENHCLPFLLVAYQQRSCLGERPVILKRLRGKTSETSCETCCRLPLIQCWILALLPYLGKRNCKSPFPFVMDVSGHPSVFES